MKAKNTMDILNEECERLKRHAKETIEGFLAEELRNKIVTTADIDAALAAEAALAGGSSKQLSQESSETKLLLAKIKDGGAGITSIVHKVLRNTKLAIHTHLNGEMPVYKDQPLF